MAVPGDRGDFDHRDIDGAEEAEPGVLRDMAQMHVDVMQVAGVDLFAQVRVGLVRQAQLDALRACEHAVEFRRSGSAGHHLHAEILAARVGALDMRRQRLRHRLGVAGAGEAAHRDSHPRLDEGGGLFGGHALVAQAGVADAVVHRGVTRWGNPKSRPVRRARLFRDGAARLQRLAGRRAGA